jgi:hypothetical protein
MIQSRLELVVGTVERRATPPEVFVCAHVTSEYGAVGEGDHAEIVDIETKESGMRKIFSPHLQ